jgi:hypothetical protein
MGQQIRKQTRATADSVPLACPPPQLQAVERRGDAAEPKKTGLIHSIININLTAQGRVVFVSLIEVFTDQGDGLAPATAAMRLLQRPEDDIWDSGKCIIWLSSKQVAIWESRQGSFERNFSSKGLFQMCHDSRSYLIS